MAGTAQRPGPARRDQDWPAQHAPAQAGRPGRAEDARGAAGLDAPLAGGVERAPWFGLLDALLPLSPASARRLALALDKRLPHFWREQRTDVLPAAERLAPLLQALEEDRIDPDGFEHAFDRLLRDERWSAEEVIEPFLRTERSAGVLETRAQETARAARRLRTNDPDARLRWAMGQIMPTLRGQVIPHAGRRPVGPAPRRGARACG